MGSLALWTKRRYIHMYSITMSSSPYLLGFQKTQAFTRKKNEYAILSKNYNPRNEALADRVLKIINPDSSLHNDHVEIEEDEI
jgi:hypothetical protein